MSTGNPEPTRKENRTTEHLAEKEFPSKERKMAAVAGK